MDEIALVRSFRSAVPERESAARDRVRRILRQERRRRRVVRSRRVWILAAAVLAGIAVVSSAFGWTSRLLDAVAGKPAPTPVREAFAVRNEARARQMPIFRDPPTMDVIAEQTHGVMGINTSVGQVILWSAPTKGGGTCWMIDIERLRRPGGVPNGGGGCSPSPLPPDVPLHYGLSGTRVGDGYLELVYGQVSVGVASVELRYPDGKAEILPVFERHFLSERRGGSRPSVMIARDSRGAEIERREIRARPLSVGPGAVPKPVGPERVVIRLDTSSGHQLTFSLAPGENGQLCEIWRYRGSRGGPSCGPDLRKRPEPDKMLITRFLWNEALDGKPLVAFRGVVGEQIARLDLRYTDGTVERVPVTERFVYFEIPPAHHNDEGFVLVGRDRAGAELDRQVID